MSAEGILAFVRCLQCYGIMCTIALSQVCIASYLSKSLQAAATHTHTQTHSCYFRGFFATATTKKGNKQHALFDATCIHVGVSENRGAKYSTLNSRILIIRTPKNKVPLIFGNSHVRQRELSYTEGVN